MSFGILRFLFGGIKMICINGEKFEKDEIVLLDYLKTNGINPQRIAIEMNGEILPKSQFNEAVFKSGDIVEIVNFVGGG